MNNTQTIFNPRETVGVLPDADASIFDYEIQQAEISSDDADFPDEGVREDADYNSPFWSFVAGADDFGQLAKTFAELVNDDYLDTANCWFRVVNNKTKEVL